MLEPSLDGTITALRRIEEAYDYAKYTLSMTRFAMKNRFDSYVRNLVIFHVLRNHITIGSQNNNGTRSKITFGHDDHDDQGLQCWACELKVIARSGIPNGCTLTGWLAPQCWRITINCATDYGWQEDSSHPTMTVLKKTVTLIAPRQSECAMFVQENGASDIGGWTRVSRLEPFVEMDGADEKRSVVVGPYDALDKCWIQYPDYNEEYPQRCAFCVCDLATSELFGSDIITDRMKDGLLALYLAKPHEFPDVSCHSHKLMMGVCKEIRERHETPLIVEDQRDADQRDAEEHNELEDQRDANQHDEMDELEDAETQEDAEERDELEDQRNANQHDEMDGLETQRNVEIQGDAEEHDESEGANQHDEMDKPEDQRDAEEYIRDVDQREPNELEDQRDVDQRDTEEHDISLPHKRTSRKRLVEIPPRKKRRLGD